MPVWLCMAGTLAYNVSRHLRGKSTLCSSTRRVLPWPVIFGGLVGLFTWLVLHVCGPMWRRP